MRGPHQCVDIKSNPTFVVLDLGCTKCMGSRVAVERLLAVIGKYGFSYERKPSTTSFSFAGGAAKNCTQKVTLWFPTNPPCSTDIEIVEEGTTPILLSLPQMKNLNVTIHLTPECEYLTCPAFGLDYTPCNRSISNHMVLDLKTMRTSPITTATNRGTVRSGFGSNVFYGDVPTVPTLVPNHSAMPATAKKKKKNHKKKKKEEEEEEETYEPEVPEEEEDDEDEAERLFSLDDDEKEEVEGIDPDEELDPSKKLKDRRRVWKKPKGVARPRTQGDADAPIAPPPGLGKGDEEEEVPPPPAPHAEKRPGKRIRKKTPAKDTNYKDVPAIHSKTLKNINDKLNNETELYKLHLKHYHMSERQFRLRTSELKLSEEVYQKYKKVVEGCEACQKHKPAPARSRISGLRATQLGDLMFIDHGSVKLDGKTYVFLVIVDAATMFLQAYPTKSEDTTEAINCLREFMDNFQVKPKAIVGDSAFQVGDWPEFYKANDIKPIPTGPFTPWPNRAEASIRLFKKQFGILVSSIKNDPHLGASTPKQLMKASSHARNASVTYGGKTPIELVFGRKPRDLINLETATPTQLTTESKKEDSVERLRILAMKAHLEARQAQDLKNDLARSLNFVTGTYKEGDKCWLWTEDKSVIKHANRGGSWERVTVIAVKVQWSQLKLPKE